MAKYKYKCSNCDGPLGPDSLEFDYQGEAIGGVCERCLANIAGVKAIFQKKEKVFITDEIVLFEKAMT